MEEAKFKTYVADLGGWLKQIDAKDARLRTQSTPLLSNIPPVRTNLFSKDFSDDVDYNKWTKNSIQTNRAHNKKEIELKKEEEKKRKPQNKNKKAVSLMSNDNIREECASLSPEELKLKGNEFFKKGFYLEAVDMYQLAIEKDPTNSIYWGNKAMANLKLNRFETVIVDCNMAIRISPKFVKAFFRRASAHLSLGDYESAIVDCNAVLHFDPSNKGAREMIKTAKSKKIELQKQIEFQQQQLQEQEQERLNKKEKEKEKEKEAEERKKVSFIIEENEDAKKKNVLRNNADNITTTTATTATTTTTTITTTTTTTTTTSVPITTSTCTPTATSTAATTTASILASGYTTTATASATTTATTTTTTTTVSEPSARPQIKVPKTSPRTAFEFERHWNQIRKTKDYELLYSYFKLIPIRHFPPLFSNTLNGDFLLDVFVLLETYYSDDEKDILEILLQLTKVKRFSIAVRFLSGEGKAKISGLRDKLKSKGSFTEEEIAQLQKEYNL